MAISSEIFNSGFIEKFDGYEFQVWKWRMEALLKMEDLWDTVVGEEKPSFGEEPSGGAEQEASEVVDTNADNSAPRMSAKEDAALARREAKAYCTILSGLEGVPARRVRTAKTAKEVWDRLLAVYESRNSWNEAYLRRKWYQSCMDEGEPVFEYIERIRLMAHELDAIGSPVPEQEKVYVLLEGLSESFQTLASCLKANKQDTEFEYVTKILLEEELRVTVWSPVEVPKKGGHEGEGYHLRAHCSRNRSMHARNGLF